MNLPLKFALAFFLGGLALPTTAAENVLAPGGTLRVVYLAGNPAQAVRDPKTGDISGVSVDLARELARQFKLPLEMTGLPGVQDVIDAVRDEKADIGFLASDPSRRGPIEFSQVYLRNPQSLVVPEASPIKTFADLDRAGVRIGVTRMDSIGLYLKRTLKVAQLVEIEGTQVAAVRQLFDTNAVDAFGANRLRLTAIMAAGPGLRMLPGSIFGVPQAIIVPAKRTERLAAIESFLNAARQSGFLQDAITRANNGTEIEPAPPTR
jgi:polar amino acid transport system substrate-binding protein